MTRTGPGRRLAAILAALALFLVACGDDDDDTATDDTTVDDTGDDASGDDAGDDAGAGDEGETVTITGVDYGYEGIPDEISAGTTLEFTNASDSEVHEIVLLKIADGENRPLSELLQLSEEEQGEISVFQGVTVAFPGEDAVFTDGTMTLSEPGRYVMVCFIPTGADPQAYRDAVADPDAEGPPDVDGGPPHVVQGMAAELTVS